MSEKRIEPRLLKGFRDFPPAQMETRLRTISILSDQARLFGFRPLETPVLEYADILTGKLGDEGEKLLYRFADHGQREVAMRYDFTVPLARYMAMHQDMAKPFKRFQVGPVWRADNTQRGRFREFYQFDIDTVGTDSSLADAEIIVFIQQALRALDIERFTIRVNYRQWLENIAVAAGMDPAQRRVFFAGLDKWDKIGGADGVTTYWQQNGVPPTAIDTLLSSLQATGNHPAQSIIDQGVSLGLDMDHVKIDPTIVRGLDYYTGLVYETILDDAPQFGSVFSGGRYDGLIGQFARESIPAVGASAGLDRLLAALNETAASLQFDGRARLFVTVYDEHSWTESLDIVTRLRQSGIDSDISFASGDIGKQMKDATGRGFSHAVIAGPDERKSGSVTLRDLVTRVDERMTLPELIGRLSSVSPSNA